MGSMIYPKGEILPWNISKKYRSPLKLRVNPHDTGKQAGKRGAVESPEQRTSKRKNIDDWHISEFMWAYLEGMQTVPRYENLSWENEAGEGDKKGETCMKPEEAAPGEAASTARTEEDNPFDIK